jgi:hypothetical protein
MVVFQRLSLTGSLRIPRTKNSGIAVGLFQENGLDIDEQVGDPEEKQRGRNPSKQVRFKEGPLRIARTDSDGLKCTQQQSSAERKTPGYSVYEPNSFTTNIIQKTTYSKE